MEASDLIVGKHYFHPKYGELIYVRKELSGPVRMWCFQLTTSDIIQLPDAELENVMLEKPKDGSFGMKFDGVGKRLWDLLPWPEIGQIVDVLTYGAKKYEKNNWQNVADSRSRYFAAMMRHMTAWFAGERIDPESGYSHLSHAGCCLLFIMWGDNNPEKRK